MMNYIISSLLLVQAHKDCFHLSNKYLLSAYYESDTVLGTEDKAVNQTSTSSQGAYILVQTKHIKGCINSDGHEASLFIQITEGALALTGIYLLGQAEPWNFIVCQVLTLDKTTH